MTELPIDPFAPADSDQHPANHGKQGGATTFSLSLEETAEWHILVALYGTEDEGVCPAGGPTLEDLRRRHEDFSIDYALLLAEHGTEEEQAAVDALPDSGEASAEVLNALATLEELRKRVPAVDPLKRPHKDARKEEWKAHARALDTDLTEGDVDSLTIPELKELTATLAKQTKSGDGA